MFESFAQSLCWLLFLASDSVRFSTWRWLSPNFFCEKKGNSAMNFSNLTIVRLLTWHWLSPFFFEKKGNLATVYWDLDEFESFGPNISWFGHAWYHVTNSAAKVCYLGRVVWILLTVCTVCLMIIFELPPIILLLFNYKIKTLGLKAFPLPP